MRTIEHRYYNNEKQILLSIHKKNNFDHHLPFVNYLDTLLNVCMNTATCA